MNVDSGAVNKRREIEPTELIMSAAHGGGGKRARKKVNFIVTQNMSWNTRRKTTRNCTKELVNLHITFSIYYGISN